MDRAHWKSPQFRERSPLPRHIRFRGGGGDDFNGPRQFSRQQWRSNYNSPYRQQSPMGYSQYSPQPQHQHNRDFMTSTPYHHQGRRPYHRGGGRFNKRPSFGSPSFDRSSGDDINNWVSSEMWSDPWRFLTENKPTPEDHSSLFRTPSNSMTTMDGEDVTKFANVDFDTSAEDLPSTSPQPNDQDSSAKQIESEIQDKDEISNVENNSSRKDTPTEET